MTLQERENIVRALLRRALKESMGQRRSVKRMGLEMYSLSERVLNNCKYVNNGTYADTGTR